MKESMVVFSQTAEQVQSYIEFVRLTTTLSDASVSKVELIETGILSPVQHWGY